MIQERDGAIERKRNPTPAKKLSRKVEVEKIYMGSEHADKAMEILGIARRDEKREEWGNYKRKQLFLEPWAVQAALSRPGGKRLSEQKRRDVIRQTADPEQLKWPRGYD